MQVQSIRNMFCFEYEKSSAEITTAMKKKIQALKAKIGEREERLAKVRKEYKITDAALLDLMKQARQASKNVNAMSYSLNASITEGPEEQIVIGAGIVNFLLTESDFISGEKEQVDKLELITRNLKDLLHPELKTFHGHKLTENELEYLGF